MVENIYKYIKIYLHSETKNIIYRKDKNKEKTIFDYLSVMKLGCSAVVSALNTRLWH